jgi:hypothetical protein
MLVRVLSIFLLFLLQFTVSASVKAGQIDFLMSGTIKTNGDPNSLGKVYFWENSSKTTAKTTWSDRDKVTALSNPVVLDSRGAATVFADGIYYAEIYDKNSVLIKTYTSIAYSGEQGLSSLFLDVGSDYGFNFSNIQSAITDQGSANKTLLFNNGSFNITDNLIIPSNLGIFVSDSASFNVSSGKTLTINASISYAPNRKIFYGSGTTNIDVSRNQIVDPQWYGSTARIGIGTTTPITSFHLVGSANISDNLIVDTTTLFVDSVNNRVGIGNTIPNAQLNVIGDINASGGILSATASITTITATTVNATTVNISNGLIVDTSTLFVDSLNNRVGIGTTVPGVGLAVNGALNIGAAYYSGTGTSNGLVVQGGVGIGTSAPNHPLHIYAGSNSSSDIDAFRLHNNGENGVNVNFTNGNGSIARITGTKKGSGASADEGAILFSTATNAVLSEKMRIDDAGNVGIATASPVSLLHVGPGGMGTIIYRTAGTAFRPQIFHSTTSAVSMIGTGVNDGTNNRRIGLFANDTDGTVGIGMGYSSGAPSFVIMNDATEQFRITSTGLVGVGIPTPSLKLVVSAGGSGSGPQASIGRYPNHGIFFNSQGGSGSYNWLIGQQNNIDTGLEFTPSTALGGTTFSTPVLVVKADGLVGVGTNSPASGLSSATNLSVGASYSGIAAPSNGAIIQGTVGIGTTSPTSLLHVNGGIDAVSVNVSGTLSVGTYALSNLNLSGNATMNTLVVTGNPWCQVYNSTLISIPNATGSSVSWNAEYADVGGLHDTSVNNSRVTINKTGWYTVNAYITWNYDKVGYRRLYITKNGMLYGGESVTSGNVGPPTQYLTQELNTILSLTAGDYIELIAYQNSGSALTIGSGSALRNDSKLTVAFSPLLN